METRPIEDDLGARRVGDDLLPEVDGETLGEGHGVRRASDDLDGHAEVGADGDRAAGGQVRVRIVLHGMEDVPDHLEVALALGPVGGAGEVDLRQEVEPARVSGAVRRYDPTVLEAPAVRRP